MELFKSKKTKELEVKARELETQVTVFSEKTRELETRLTRSRSYQAASYNRLFQDWIVSTRSADAELFSSIKTIRNRARDLAMNTSYIRRYLDLCLINILGPDGLYPVPEIKDTNGNIDTLANAVVQQGYDEWAKSVTADGKMTAADYQRLIVESTARDGEVFVRMIYGSNAGNKFNFALQIIEADLVPETLNAVLSNGNQIRMGIEINKYGRVVAIYVGQGHPGDYQGYNLSANYDRIPAEEIIHYGLPNRAHQTRYVSWMAPVMTTIKMLDGFVEAYMVACRAGASKMGFLVPQPDSNGDYITENDENGAPLQNLEAGIIEQLPNGMDFKFADPTFPSANYPENVKSFRRDIAVGLSVNYNSLFSDVESANYSSIRSGTIEDRDRWRVDQSRFIKHEERITSEWLKMAILSNALNISLPMNKFTKFNARGWACRGWDWVDPLKDSKATVSALENGLLSLKDYYNEKGKDYIKELEQLAYEKELLAGKKLNFAYISNQNPGQVAAGNAVVTTNNGGTNAGN